MPPLPGFLPGDHRPPPLGRMSSPPIHGRFSPDSRYSPYDRDDSPPMSPTYTDSDYRRGRSPPPPHSSRTYSPYSNKSRGQWDDMRDFRDRLQQQQPRIKVRNHKGKILYPIYYALIYTALIYIIQFIKIFLLFMFH